MKVLWVFSALSAQHVRLADYLTRRHDISLEVMCRWDGRPPWDPPSIPCSYLACRHKLDFAARKVIRAKLRSGGFDIVNAYTSRDVANVIGACRGLRPMPKIAGYRGTINRLHLLDPANWITFWHPRVAKIVCVCHATHRALRDSGIGPSKLATVWEGCDPDSLQTPPRSALAEFNIPENAFVVGAVANMRPVKGIDLLLEAALRLADVRDIYWLLIGDIRDPRIGELASDHRLRDRLRLAGPRPGGGRLAGLFDVYAAPSRMEGLSMAIMEAMAQKVCPVVTDVGGSPELVRDRRDGLVVPSEDSCALARAIRSLYDAPDLRRKLAESAHRRVLREFSIASWGDRLYHVYRSLMQAEARRAA